ncbi:MAG: 50S ribosomal protein L23 [Candidatus Improbicoccus pseudotrichonymphae]|uniref:Large ribosomal subunit protein uL23 n=1 Tax=Candidatus Improbicoccus pseudotrichonymphae TaxID=3033792 RepID=A0AA48I9Y7_9FIRM|nr:MAG: 50S ribosomal protein L23 [Candidatus Improbicoccus pseudotrichonymphae]
MKTYSQDIIIKPIISEKSNFGIPEHRYTFKVARSANKVQIKKAVEDIFDLKVEKVNTLNVRGVARRRKDKVGFTPSWKKAIVTLKPGQKGIEFFDSML